MLLIAWVHSKVKRNKTWVHSKRSSSDGGLVRNGRERLRRVVLGGDGVCGGGEDGEALEVYALALCLCLCVELAVALDAVDELLPALGVPDVLNTDVYSLLDVSVANNLVDDDTNGTGGDVVDDTSATIRAGPSQLQSHAPSRFWTDPW